MKNYCKINNKRKINNINNITQESKMIHNNIKQITNLRDIM